MGGGRRGCRRWLRQRAQRSRCRHASSLLLVDMPCDSHVMPRSMKSQPRSVSSWREPAATLCQRCVPLAVVVLPLLELLVLSLGGRMDVRGCLGRLPPTRKTQRGGRSPASRSPRSVALKAGCCCRGAHLELLRVLADEVTDEGAAPLLVRRVLLRAMDRPTVEEQRVCTAYKRW